MGAWWSISGLTREERLARQEALFGKVDTFAGSRLEGGVRYPRWTVRDFDFGGIDTILVTFLVLAMVVSWIVNEGVEVFFVNLGL